MEKLKDQQRTDAKMGFLEKCHGRTTVVSLKSLSVHVSLKEYPSVFQPNLYLLCLDTFPCTQQTNRKRLHPKTFIIEANGAAEANN